MFVIFCNCRFVISCSSSVHFFSSVSFLLFFIFYRSRSLQFTAFQQQVQQTHAAAQYIVTNLFHLCFSFLHLQTTTNNNKQQTQCNLLYNKKPSECTIPQKMICGALATFPEILAISPFEVAKLGLQTDTRNVFKNDMFAFMKQQYASKGFSGLYVGWAGMQARQSIFTGVFFGTVSSYRESLKDQGVSPFFAKLGGGFAAGVTGALAGNIPADVVRSVVQKRNFADPNRKAHGISPAGILEHVKVAGDIMRDKGEVFIKYCFCCLPLFNGLVTLTYIVDCFFFSWTTDDPIFFLFIFFATCII